MNLDGQEGGEKMEKKQSWFAKHKILTGVFAIILLLIIIGAVGGSKTSNQSTQKPEQSTTKKEEPKKTTYAVGETINLSNHQIMVNSVNKDFQSGNEFDKPQNTENQFVTVNITIINTGKADLPANMYGFKLEDETGAQRNTAFISGLDNQLEWVTLSLGGKISGNIGFEVKANSKTLKLHYSGGFLGGGEIVVNL